MKCELAFLPRSLGKLRTVGRLLVSLDQVKGESEQAEEGHGRCNLASHQGIEYEVSAIFAIQEQLVRVPALVTLEPMQGAVALGTRAKRIGR